MKRRKDAPLKEDFRYIFSELQALGENFDKDAEFEILSSDKQYDTRYGSFSYNEKNLEEIADNFNSNVRGIEIAVDLNHEDSKKAYAWILPKSARVGDSALLENKKSLFVKFYRYTPEGLELMSTGAFRYFSVELLLKWKRFVNGKLKLFKNVLFGLALTNSPVIKDMKPAYSEPNKILSSNSLTMELFNKFLSLLKGKDIVTKDEKDTMKAMYEELTAEEQEAVDSGDKTLVEAKDEEAPEDKELAETKKKLEDAEKKLTEATTKLTDADKDAKRLSELETKVRKNELAEKVDAFVLSDDVETGFVAKDKEAVVDFLATLSEEQVEEFEKVLSMVKSVKFGAQGKEETEENKDDDAKEKKAQELSEKIAKEKDIPLHVALSEAYEKLGMVE